MIDFEELLRQVNEVKDIQGQNGNWNSNSYMLGLYNGIELIISIMERREPVPRSKPNKWLEDLKLTPIIVRQNIN